MKDTPALTRDEDEAESLAQRIVVRTCRCTYWKFRRRDPLTPVSTWLHSLTFREWVSQSRIAHFRDALHALEIAIAWPSTEHTENTKSPGNSREAVIRLGLLALPAKPRALLLLREVVHRSAAKLAQIAGCEEYVVREYLYRAQHDLSIALLKKRSKEANRMSEGSGPLGSCLPGSRAPAPSQGTSPVPR